MSSFPPPPPNFNFDNQASLSPRNDGKATAALVCGILGLLLPFGIVLGALALFFGIQSRKRIANSGGMLKGDGKALAGIILGAAGIGLFFLFLAG